MSLMFVHDHRHFGLMRVLEMTRRGRNPSANADFFLLCLSTCIADDLEEMEAEVVTKCNSESIGGLQL